MSLATTYCRAAAGIDAPPVSVEVHLANGLPAFHIVGLPEKAVQESRDRVRGALINSGFEFPARRITVNLAPADLPKEGSRFNLQIEVPPLPPEALTQKAETPEDNATVRKRVTRARQRQQQRQGCANALLQGAALAEHAVLDDTGHALLHNAMHRLGLSARGYHRVLRVARTIADLASQARIDTAHLTEAIGYRRLDRQSG